MRKMLTIAALLALLVIPMMVVGAAETCPDSGGWTKIDRGGEPDYAAAEAASADGYCYKSSTDILFSRTQLGGSQDNGSWIIDGMEHALSHWAYHVPEPEPCDVNDTTHRVLQSTEYGEWSDWVWDAGQQLFVRSRTVTEHWVAISDLDGETVCARGDVELDDEVETRRPEGRITLRQDCNGWGLMQEGQLIDSGTWDLPFELEVAASRFVDYRIFEEEKCLQVRGEIFIRIGGRCTEDGDSQEIGYVFRDGDFDGARLIITRQDGVEVANEGEGSVFFPARAAGYSWQIIWFNGETREVLDEGEFTVDKCDLPDPTPTPKPPDEHPPTGGEMDAGLAVVTGLMGFALAGIGGSILFMKRRASR